MDSYSADMQCYKPRTTQRTVEDLKDDTEYTIVALCKHKFKNGLKYVLKIKGKEHSGDSLPHIYKSSYYMEQCLNTVDLETYMEMPFIHFTTGKVRVTPQKHESKFIGIRCRR